MQKFCMNIIQEHFKENSSATLNMKKQQVTIKQKQDQIHLHELRELSYQIHIYKIQLSLQLHQIHQQEQQQEQQILL